MLGQLAAHGVERLAGLVLDVDDGGGQALAHGRGHDVSHLRVDVPLVAQSLERLGEVRQVKVPVVAGSQLGRGARQLRDGPYELLGVELVAEVALVGIGLLGLAAAHGAAADHLATVQERLGLGVIELQRGALLEEAALVESADPLVGELGMNLAGAAQAGALVDVEGDLVVVERGLLSGVEARDVVGDGALESLALHDLAVALHDRRAVAVGARDEQHVALANAVAQEAREEVRGDEHAGDVAEVQVLVAVGHARRDDGAGGEAGTRFGHGDPSCCGAIRDL